MSKIEQKLATCPQNFQTYLLVVMVNYESVYSVDSSIVAADVLGGNVLDQGLEEGIEGITSMCEI